MNAYTCIGCVNLLFVCCCYYTFCSHSAHGCPRLICDVMAIVIGVTVTAVNATANLDPSAALKRKHSECILVYVHMCVCVRVCVYGWRCLDDELI